MEVHPLVAPAAARSSSTSARGDDRVHLALDHPEKVASLTLISTSPAVPAERDLPPMSEELQAYYAAPPPEHDWADRAAVVEYVVESAQIAAEQHRPGHGGRSEP